MSRVLIDPRNRKRSEQSDAQTAIAFPEHRRFCIPEAERDQTWSGWLHAHRPSLLPEKQHEKNEWLLLSNPSATTSGIIGDATGNVLMDLAADVSEADITATQPQALIVRDPNGIPFRACLVSYPAGSEFSPWLTDPLEDQDDIRRAISLLAGIGQQEYFEDGMESAFSRGLVALIEKYGEPAIDELSDFVSSGEMNGELAAEALVCLGRIEDPCTFLKRRSLLETSLFSSSYFIRDGALLGLSYLDDPHAIPYVKRAVDSETNAQLRQYMQQLLREMEAAD